MVEEGGREGGRERDKGIIIESWTTLARSIKINEIN